MVPSQELNEPGALFREFKRAYYQFLLDSNWANEVLNFEQQHLLSVSLIVAGVGQEEEGCFLKNPLDQKQQDFGVEYDLPGQEDISEITKEMIKHQYVVEIRHCGVLGHIHSTNASIVELRGLQDKSLKLNNSSESASTNGQSTNLSKKLAKMPAAEKVKHHVGNGRVLDSQECNGVQLDKLELQESHYFDPKKTMKK